MQVTDPNAGSLTIDGKTNPSLTISTGDSHTFNVRLTGSDANDTIRAVIADKSIISFTNSQERTIKTNRPGTTTLTYYTDRGAVATATVTVLDSSQKVIVTASASEGGTITPSGQHHVQMGTTPRYAIRSNQGYRIKAITVNGVGVNVTQTLDITSIQRDTTIRVEFELIPQQQPFAIISGEFDAGGNYVVRWTDVASFANIPNLEYIYTLRDMTDRDRQFDVFTQRRTKGNVVVVPARELQPGRRYKFFVRFEVNGVNTLAERDFGTRVLMPRNGDHIYRLVFMNGREVYLTDRELNERFGESRANVIRRDMAQAPRSANNPNSRAAPAAAAILIVLQAAADAALVVIGTGILVVENEEFIRENPSYPQNPSYNPNNLREDSQSLGNSSNFSYPAGSLRPVWQVDVTADAAVRSAVAGELEEEARRHGVFKCHEAVNAMVNILVRYRQEFEYAEIYFGMTVAEYEASETKVKLTMTRGGGVLPNGTVIATNGYHVGIQYNGKIYCNVHPEGLPVSDWFSNFYVENDNRVPATHVGQQKQDLHNMHLQWSAVHGY